MNAALVVPRDDVAADLTIADRLEGQGAEVERASVPGYGKMMVDAHESVPPSAVIDVSVRWLFRASEIDTRIADKNHGGPHRDDSANGLGTPRIA